MTTKADVMRIHRAHPDWTVRQIADELGCLDSYVRATFQRANKPTPKTKARSPEGLRMRIQRLRRQLSEAEADLARAEAR